MQFTSGTKNYTSHLNLSTIKELINYCAETYKSKDAFIFHDKPNGLEIRKSYLAFQEDINALGTALLSIGAQGTHIVVIGNNSYKWAVAHNAIINGTGVSIPLDKQLAEPEIKSLTKRGKAEYFFFDAAHLKETLAVAEENLEIRKFIFMDPENSESGLPEDPRFLSYDTLLEEGRALLADEDTSYTSIVLDPNILVSLLFTSGTTALSKGVMLSHKNICSNINNINATIQLQPGYRALSVLPLHHTLENSIGLFYLLASGVTICYTDGLRYLTNNLKEWEINVMLGVPLLFENIYNQIQATLNKSGKTRLVSIMRKVSNGLRKVGIDIRRKVFKQILDALGGGMALFVSGAAPIDVKIIKFFDDIGITFLMGYGLTETSPVVSVTSFHLNVLGSVGRPLANIEVAIDTEETARGSIGEVLTKSDCVMLGYYENEAATKEVFTEDGWFRTGDIGYLDRKGCIYITGRKKSMIVLTNGKKVFPEEIELLTDRIPGVKESIVWGEQNARGSVDICAKFVIDPENLPEDCKNGSKELSAFLKEEIKEINGKMPVYKAIKYFIYTEQDLIKTTTLKVKRPMEEAAIRDMLNAKSLTMKTADGMHV